MREFEIAKEKTIWRRGQLFEELQGLIVFTDPSMDNRKIHPYASTVYRVFRDRNHLGGTFCFGESILLAPEQCINHREIAKQEGMRWRVCRRVCDFSA